MKHFYKWFSLHSLSVLLVLNSGCTTSDQARFSLQPEQEFDLGSYLGTGGPQVGCRSMLDTYCSRLNSPDAQGNLLVGRGAASFPILQGQTKNDFSTAQYLYSRAKIRSRDYLPPDFREALGQHRYFSLLEQALDRSPRARMTLDGRVRSMWRDHDLEKTWNAAVNETVLRRMSRRYPGFYRLSDDLLSLEEGLDRNRIRKELVSEISRAIWEHDPNWKKVERDFEVMRKHFLRVISRLEIPEALRDDWLRRLGEVRLVIPGAIPAIADSECSSTQANAYYYSYLNLITVCAGDFNGESILQTLAHELAHALDSGRSRYLQQRRSEYGRRLATLRGEVCGEAAFSCASWERFKGSHLPDLARLSAYQPDLADFQRCLKRSPHDAPMSADDIQRFAEMEINSQLEDLASSGVFLRLTKQQVPLANGKMAHNPNYLNPCRYKVWSQGEEPIDDTLTQLLFFTAEYRCSREKEAGRKLRESILVSKQMAMDVTAAAIRMEGEFSPRENIVQEGFASSPSERFADVLGSYAFADRLKRITTADERRHTFLASSSWQCERPSLDTIYPEESSVQQAFVSDSHADMNSRKSENFTAPIREALSCEPDFKFKACELGFKK